MINVLAQRITEYFISHHAISLEESEKYIYCFEILLSTIIDIVAIAVIAICTATYLETLVFLLAFSIMRSYAGGYHADTHFRCFVILMMVYSCMVICVRQFFSYTIISGVMNIVSGGLYIAVAPVAHKNNPMSHSKRSKLRIKSLVAYCVFSAISTMLLCFGVLDSIAFTLSYVNIAVALSCLCAIIKEKLLKIKNK